MKNIISAFAALALIGSISGALADTTTAPNGGGQDTSRSSAVPLASQGQNANGVTTNSADGSQPAPNGGGQDTSKSSAVPAASKQQ